MSPSITASDTRCREEGCPHPRMGAKARCRLHYNARTLAQMKVRNARYRATPLPCVTCRTAVRQPGYSYCRACRMAGYRAQREQAQALDARFRAALKKKPPPDPVVRAYREEWMSVRAQASEAARRTPDHVHSRFTKVLERAMAKPLSPYDGPERTTLHDLGRSDALVYAGVSAPSGGADE